MSWIGRHRKYVIPGAIVLVGGLAWLAFGFFGVHLLFVDDEVSEPPPVFAAAPTQPDTTTIGTTSAVAADPSPTTSPPAPPAVSTHSTVPTPPAPTTAPNPPATTAPPIVTEYSGTFVGRDHPTTGTALVLGNGTGQRFVRFESFETDNGPDLNVYLVNSSAGDVNDFVDLGDLKGNIGEQNYEVPEGVDLDVYDTVLIWCVRFSSPFGQATLTPA